MSQSIFKEDTDRVGHRLYVIPQFAELREIVIPGLTLRCIYLRPNDGEVIRSHPNLASRAVLRYLNVPLSSWEQRLHSVEEG